MAPLSLDHRRPHFQEQDPLPQVSTVCPVLRLRAGELATTSDEVIEEVPVALVYNGISHAVMLASPADLADFALGFSLSEGILGSAAELYDLEIRPGCDGISVEMTIAASRFMALKEKRRSLAGRSGCGLCGVESLAGVTRLPEQRPNMPDWSLSMQAIEAGLRQLPHWQPLRQSTGSAHGAAWADRQGNIQLLREDVGRHNALDKLVGALAHSELDQTDGFALVTSRASYEMVQKTASAGISVLLALSAPTALAIRQAQAAGILLIGFARPGQWVAYSHGQRLGAAPPPSLM